MRLLKKALVVGLIAVSGFLYAQPDPDANKPPDPAPAPSTDAAPPPTGQLSVAEMTTTSGELVKQVRVDLRHVLHLQEVSRKQKDVIKLNCVNDKLVMMKPIANRFDALQRELAVLLVDSSTERFAVYENVTSGADAINRLRKEADQCAGEPELTGESDNLFSAPDLPLDPGKGDMPWDDPVEPPGYASPYS